MKILWAAILSLVFSLSAYGVEYWVNSETGNNYNPGTQQEPFKTFSPALDAIGSKGGTIYSEGIFYDGVKISMIKYPLGQPLIVDGQEKTLFYGFEGIYDPETFDPLKLPDRTYGIPTIMDGHNVVFKNFTTWGGRMEALSINDSYPEVGVRNITLDNIKVRYGRSRGIFMGGHNIQYIKIYNCYVTETVYGDVSHGIYLTGGAWTNKSIYGPVRYIDIRNTKVDKSGGRHGLQLNGRFEYINIQDCEFVNNQLCGISLIGCRWVFIHNSLIWGNNKQCIVIYDSEHDWNPKEMTEEQWMAAHHSNGLIYIYNNTMFVGPHAWMHDPNHHNIPDNQPCILVNNKVNYSFFPNRYRNLKIQIYDNVMVSPWPRIVQFWHAQEALVTTVHTNLIWTYHKDPSAITIGGYGDFTIESLQSDYRCMPWYYKNIIVDPEFSYYPEYDFIDLNQPPYEFDFSKHYSYADLYSYIAQQFGNGKEFH